jgi:hypothetical protein
VGATAVAACRQWPASQPTITVGVHVHALAFGEMDWSGLGTVGEVDWGGGEVDSGESARWIGTAAGRRG